MEDVLGTFRMLAELPQRSLGAYIISMAHTASDVLAVVLLQKECGGAWRAMPCAVPRLQPACPGFSPRNLAPTMGVATTLPLPHPHPTPPRRPPLQCATTCVWCRCLRRWTT